jgi:SRSO17 transposase
MRQEVFTTSSPWDHDAVKAPVKDWKPKHLEFSSFSMNISAFSNHVTLLLTLVAYRWV